MANLFDLFDESLKSGRDLVPSPPTTLADLSSSFADASGVDRKINLDRQVIPKVDYSDFKNFVFFNSALDYFNISGERIINEYPTSGTFNDHLMFVSESDGYQRYLLEKWPKSGTTSFGEPAPIVSLGDSSLTNFIVQQQEIATAYDRNNANIITNLIPAQFLFLEEELQTNILRNVLYLLARQFDELKVKIDQSTYLLQMNYTEFDQTPDALLADVLSFWGWSPKGNFLNADAFQYLFGYGVSGSSAQKLDIDLNEIKNEFWRRTLNNLAYIYKTKGTRESAEALLRVYGLDEKSVKLKEFGTQPEVAIQTMRINSEKSAWALRLADNTYVNGAVPFTTGVFTVEMDIRLPSISGTDDMLLPSTGTVFHIGQGNLAEELWVYRPISGTSGQVKWVRSSASVAQQSVTMADAPVFDGTWHHVTVRRSGTWSEIKLTHLNENYIDLNVAVTGAISNTYGNGTLAFGPGGITPNPSVGWVTNARFWNTLLSETEIQDHTLNPFSFGADTVERSTNLISNLTFDQELDVSGAFDVTRNLISGPVVSGSYDRFLFEYNFIASPDYGWNEEKIRTHDVVEIPVEDKFRENNAVSLEFNLIDALNEDISCIISSMDNWNNLIGDPANRHRDSYPGLDKLRRQYFSRLTGRINFRIFADFLDFYDRSFVDMIRRLLPARANFKGAEFVIESHMLERPKVQYPYKPHDLVFVPEGQIYMIAPRPTIPAAVTGSA